MVNKMEYWNPCESAIYAVGFVSTQLVDRCFNKIWHLSSNFMLNLLCGFWNKEYPTILMPKFYAHFCKCKKIILWKRSLSFLDIYTEFQPTCLIVHVVSRVYPFVTLQRFIPLIASHDSLANYHS